MTPRPSDGRAADLRQARESFARFYAEHRSIALVVLRVALSGTGLDPDDIASRMWMKIWALWREREPAVEMPKAFVRQCARRAAIDALRTETDLLLDINELDSAAARRWTEDDRPRRASISPEQGSCTSRTLLTDKRLIAAVEALTPVERLVILTWIETVPPPTSEQIARTLKIPSASTVRGHRMRAMKKLRDILDAPDTGPEGTNG